MVLMKWTKSGLLRTNKIVKTRIAIEHQRVNERIKLAKRIRKLITASSTDIEY